MHAENPFKLHTNLKDLEGKPCRARKQAASIAWHMHVSETENHLLGTVLYLLEIAIHLSDSFCIIVDRVAA